MNLNRIRSKLFACRQILKGFILPTYSQAGEDSILSYLFYRLGKDKIRYIEIGTNHPFISNNTFLFYTRGSQGVCVEPDPSLQRLIKKFRPRDTLEGVGICGGADREESFFVFPKPYSGWNTFSRTDAEMKIQGSGIQPEKVMQVRIVNINRVLEKNFESPPDLMSIDAEGLDLEILSAIEYGKFGPDVICVESVMYNEEANRNSSGRIKSILASNGYEEYASTNINTIFCRSEILNFMK